MRLLFILRTVTRAGGGIYYAAAGLADALVSQGQAVSVAGGGDDHLEADLSVWGGADLHPVRKTGFYGLHHELVGYTRKGDFDVSHVHGIWSAASIMGRAVPANNALVVSPHGMLDPWILSRSPTKKALHAAFLEKPLMRRSVIHALCQSEAESCAAYMPSAAERIHIVPNGINPPDAEPVPGAAKSGTVYLGRLHEKKQALELIAAWKRLPPSEDNTLTIAGWGSDAYEAAVTAAVADAPNITFIGSCYGEEKVALLSKARYFILPSLSEGLPMSVLEALSYGVVPIITDSCNLPELIEDGTALHLREDIANLADLYAAQATATPAERTARAEACRLRSHDYHWDRIARRMEPVYDAALRMRRDDVA